MTPGPSELPNRGQTLFLLSPASCTGRKAEALLRPGAANSLASRLRGGSHVSLGEVFSSLSGLYFRGKLAYALAFGRSRDPVPSASIITPSRGLMPHDQPVTLGLLREFAATRVDLDESRYRTPLERAVAALAGNVTAGDQVVLLGSIATDKYVGILEGPLGLHLRFPAEFVGRGDMSRGGLMLRCVEESRELEYVPTAGAIRRGSRPPRLERRR